MSAPEFSRPLPFSAVRTPGHVVEISASPAERAALALRLGLIDLPSLTARWRLSPEETGCIVAEVTVLADVVQECVVTLDPVPQRVEETVRLRFLPPGVEPTDDDPETPDDIPCEREVMDLGEATAETLALLLDPYPRAEGAVLPDAATDADSGPFAGLSRLRGTPQ
ncbi:YceD family protein [Humitalea sp. 24SJ18S-53]|uniref:YceD family protein n=1 Tax=Humitalea sp. 24SJ18S-53 TaxID=3422307 RepID=UPI003D66C8F3